MKNQLFFFILSVLFVFGCDAQTHYPIYNPNYKYGAKEQANAYESMVSLWSVTMDEVQKQVKASDKEFAGFTNYYQTYIDSERNVLMQKARAGKLDTSNVHSYLNKKKQNLVALYNTYLLLKNTYPNRMPKKLTPSYTAPTCDSACTNMDFSSGNFTGWYGYYGSNTSTINGYQITSINGGALGAIQKGAYCPASSTYQIHLTDSSSYDWFLNNYHSIKMSQASPWGSGYSAMIGDSVNNGAFVAILSQEFMVTPTTNSLTYAYSVLMENPSHTYYFNPFFSVILFDQNGDTISTCGEYIVHSGPGVPGFVGEYYPVNKDSVYWKNWTQVNVPLINYVGQCVTIQFEIADCGLGGHFGYAYVDASCSKLAITSPSPNGIICGKHGTIKLEGPGGEASYAWTGPKNGIVGSDTIRYITADTVGKYTLIVTPVTGKLCSDTLYYTVNGWDSITATASALGNIRCYNGKGGAYMKEINGTGPFIYAWDPLGGSKDTASGLNAGTYITTITDANGCAATASVTLTQPTPLTATTTATPVNCFGGNNGTATVVGSGGFLPYTYLWSPKGGTTAHASGLSTGIYNVSITDSNGCSATAAAIVVQPPLLTAATTSANISCFGGVGSAAITAAGGTSPYTYSWSNGQTTTNVTGLSAGTYTVTLQDNNGCSATSPVSITQPSMLTAVMGTIHNPLCNGDTGNAKVIAGGGTFPYAYSWTPSGGSNATGTGLAAGNYTVTVTDSNACMATTGVTITQPSVLIATMGAIHNPPCNGDTGNAVVTLSGGTSPYTYSWSPSGGSNATGTGLTAGSYTVTFKGAGNCTAKASVVITQPPAMVITKHFTNVDSSGDCNGAAWVTVSGGAPSYTYNWSPGGGTKDSIIAKCAGQYCCAVTDNNGCNGSICVTILNVTGIDNITSASNLITVYPNPNTGTFIVTNHSHSTVNSYIELYNTLGEKILTSSLSPTNENTLINMKNQSEGLYLYRVLTENGKLLGEGKIIVQK